MLDFNHRPKPHEAITTLIDAALVQEGGGDRTGRPQCYSVPRLFEKLISSDLARYPQKYPQRNRMLSDFTPFAAISSKPAYQVAGLMISVPGSVSGNSDALRWAACMWRTEEATAANGFDAPKRDGDSRVTGLLSSCTTMRIGSTRSVSFEITTAPS